MKILSILLSLLISANSFSQNKDNANMLGVVSVMMVPAIFVCSGLSAQDKPGKVFFGSMAGISAAAGVGCLYFSEKKKVLHYSMFFLAGIMDGFNEELTHHYPQVKEKLPWMNDQWFDPAISWKNKHDWNYPLSTTLLVAPTDAYHSTRFLNKVFIMGGIFTFDKPKSFKEGLIKALKISASYSIGKGLTHYLITN